MTYIYMDISGCEYNKKNFKNLNRLKVSCWPAFFPTIMINDKYPVVWQ